MSVLNHIYKSHLISFEASRFSKNEKLSYSGAYYSHPTKIDYSKSVARFA